MRLLIDENCAEREFVFRLRSGGHDVEIAAQVLGYGASDNAIYDHAVAHARAIVTKDADDFRSLAEKREAHPGLLLIYEDAFLPKRSAKILAQAIDNVAATYPDIESYIIVLNEFIW